jgi:hypothetical protein
MMRMMGLVMIFRSSPDDTLLLPAGIAVYGGFAGDETAREERDWRGRPTILSGDSAAMSGFRVHHVVTAAQADGAVLDGFVVAGGNARNDGMLEAGGGVLILGGSPTVANCVLTDNKAAAGGGAASLDAKPLFQGCVFSRNHRRRSDGQKQRRVGEPTQRHRPDG